MPPFFDLFLWLLACDANVTTKLWQPRLRVVERPRQPTYTAAAIEEKT